MPSQFEDAHPDGLDRVTPPCPHFGPCGGCQLQNLAYPDQLTQKAARLHTLFAPANLTLPPIQLHPSPPLAYRNRIRLTLGEVDGQLRAGYIRNSAAGQQSTTSNQQAFLPITQCPIAAPILWRAAEAFLALFNEDSSTWLRTPQIPDQLELFTSADESSLQFTLYLRTQAKTLPPRLTSAFITLCEALRSQIPELTGAGIAILPVASTQRSRRTETARPGPTWGAPGLNYTVGETTYWIPRTAFFQINRFLLPELLALVVGEGKTNRTGLAWDLYAGVGLFSRTLVASFTEVTAVEIAEPAFTALASTKLPNLRVVKTTTLDFLRTNVIQRDRPDLIVLDPPRTGAGPEVCALLARIASPTLIYVSCSPETLPNDLRTLTASGYTVTQLHLFDLFPQTTHIETVAILTR